jgi:hypothetical protein
MASHAVISSKSVFLLWQDRYCVYINVSATPSVHQSHRVIACAQHWTGVRLLPLERSGIGIDRSDLGAIHIYIDRAAVRILGEDYSEACTIEQQFSVVTGCAAVV